MARELAIDGVAIGDDTDCWVIAEIGHNHQGDVEQAKAMFRSAKEAGADAVKLQKRDNRRLFTDEYFDKPYDHENSFGTTYGEHREYLEFGWDEYRELQDFAAEIGISFFATAFDEPSVDFLAELEVPAIKIASGDLKSVQLLQYAAKVGVPLIVSTGAATMEDVERAYEALSAVTSEFAILQCTAAYPPAFEQLDLGVIPTYRERFPETVIGYSGHDNGIAMATVAYTLGARIVEKHFTLNRAMKGTDHPFSLEPVGLRKLVRDLRRARVAIGDGEKRCHETERAPGLKMGKKIVASRPLHEGHVITEDDVEFRTPGDGLWPHRLPEVVGRRLLRDLHAQETISLDHLDTSAG